MNTFLPNINWVIRSESADSSSYNEEIDVNLHQVADAQIKDQFMSREETKSTDQLRPKKVKRVRGILRKLRKTLKQSFTLQFSSKRSFYQNSNEKVVEKMEDFAQQVSFQLGLEGVSVRLVIALFVAKNIQVLDLFMQRIQ